MHELRVGAGHGHELGRDLIGRIEDGHALFLGKLGIVQAVPHVGVHEVRVLHGGLAVVGDGHRAAGSLAVLLADGQKFGRDLVANGSVLHEVHAHLGADEHLRDAHLGAVAHEHHLAVLDALAFRQVLHHGHEVAHLLGGMVVVRHAVDDRSRRILGQVDQVLVTVDARHDDVQQTSHDPSRVLDGLVAAQLDGAGSEELGVAAHVRHGRLERDARAGGHLLEDHAERAVLQNERVGPGLDHALHGSGQLDHVEQLFLGEVVGVQEVLLVRCRHGILLSDRRSCTNSAIVTDPVGGDFTGRPLAQGRYRCSTCALPNARGLTRGGACRLRGTARRPRRTRAHGPRGLTAAPPCRRWPQRARRPTRTVRARNDGDMRGSAAGRRDAA